MIYLKSSLVGLVAALVSFALVAALNSTSTRSEGLLAVAGGFGVGTITIAVLMFVVGFLWEFRRIS
jgi:hypothetical protein